MLRSDGGMARPVRRQSNNLPDGRPVKITFGDMREMGVRGVLVYCADYQCNHSVALSADRWPVDLRLSSNRFLRGGASVTSDHHGR
jgi:hypothetical protein